MPLNRAFGFGGAPADEREGAFLSDIFHLALLPRRYGHRRRVSSYFVSAAVESHIQKARF